MKRKIYLYIGEQLVDLDNQSLVLFNFSQSDLSNPTVVKNSYSQQITLKGTARNNRVFGSSFRLDRRSDNGFDPSRKTSFTIYNEMNEILESGYVKLDSISRHNSDVQYKVTLYGGLGSFFYNLSYDENGNKKTLASLDFMETDMPDNEFDFKINATSVSNAWYRLTHVGSGVSMWDFINFCPCYNGIPESGFDAKHAICHPNNVGLSDTLTDDEGYTYTTKDGYCLVSLAEAAEEWSIKDLRSYLQRPMISFDKILSAICNPNNNGGYNVDVSMLIDESHFPYAHMWMTLPMLSALLSSEQEGNLSLVPEYEPTTDTDIAEHRIDYGTTSVPSGSEEIADFYFTLAFALSNSSLFLNRTKSSVLPNGNTQTVFTNLFLQAIAYDQSNNVVGGSDVYVVGNLGTEGMSAEAIANGQRYVPTYNNEVNYISVSNSELDVLENSNNVYSFDYQFHIQASGRNVHHYIINLQVGRGLSLMRPGIGTTFTYYGVQSTPQPYLYDNSSTAYQTTDARYELSTENTDTVKYKSKSSVRSNALITKKILLSSTKTPAEYLLSFAKMFGLYFTCDNATKSIRLLRKNDFYQNQVVDITRMVDHSKGITIKPMAYDAKWYEMITEGVEGGFYKDYLDQYGVKYGNQKINTGYEYNLETKQLMDSVVFKNAVAILGKSKYYNIITTFIFGAYRPSQFIDSGNKYTLWDQLNGTSLETDISIPNSNSDVSYYNPSFPGYDVAGALKIELRDASNKPLDGSNVLVMYAGAKTYPYFHLTDDIAAMDTINNGVPCYFLDGGSSQGISVPVMSRYHVSSGMIDISLDFGMPKEYQIPGVVYQPDSAIYPRGWKKYLTDLYDKNTKVLTCYVRFNGMKVSQELLKKFYWFENSIWVLNKITNYSLTTWDAIQCEFIQVQDKNDYLLGQNYDEQ